MKILINLFGIAGVLLLMIRLLGNLIDLSYPNIYLYAGLALILLVWFPLMLVDRRRYNKKIDQIIKSYADKPEAGHIKSTGKSDTKGWSMNDSPYRERKSGLRWGGGNIKGANASRGQRKSFLK